MKNNKGFSLIELIIVIAILSILTSVSIVGLGYLYSTNIKSSIKKIDSALQQAQSYTVSKSTGNRDVSMTLQQDGENYYVEVKQTPYGASPVTISREEIGKKNLKVKFIDSNGAEYMVNSSNPLVVHFDRSTGGLLNLEGSTYKLSKIVITTGDTANFGDSTKCCNIEISGVTGKTKVTMFQ